MNILGCVVFIPPTTCTQLSIGVLVTNHNTKKRSINCTCNNIGGCASKNEDYVICNHNLINVLITNDKDTTPLASLSHTTYFNFVGKARRYTDKEKTKFLNCDLSPVEDLLGYWTVSYLSFLFSQ